MDKAMTLRKRGLQLYDLNFPLNLESSNLTSLFVM
jgi:hypothetical protein